VREGGSNDGHGCMSSDARPHGEGKGANENEAARRAQICMRCIQHWVHKGEGKQMKQCDACKCAHVTLSHPHVWH